MKDKTLKIIISGGGTGGHIFPALAIADALRRRIPTVEILFVGAEGRMEMERIPASGYDIIGLKVKGFNRRQPWKNVGVMFLFLKAMRKAMAVIHSFKPDLVIGVGGYASAAIVRAAQACDIPTLIQEQNGFPGKSNKLLMERAGKICVAYPGMERFFPKEKIVLTGNPIRRDLLPDRDLRAEASSYFGLSTESPTILLLGGSLGARSLNEAILSNLDTIASDDIQFIWQTGKFYYDRIVREVEKRGCPKHLVVRDFLTRMELAYAMADLVISRAGALSIAELAMLGKPSILVPSPNVAEDHQTKNARLLSEAKAAILIPDKDVKERLLSDALLLVRDRERLSTLRTQITNFSHLDADEKIVDEALSLIEKCKQ